MLPTELAAELGVLAPEHAAADEETLVRWLAQHIAELLQHRTEFFFNVLYCMDVSEAKMHDALLPNAPEPASDWDRPAL